MTCIIKQGIKDGNENTQKKNSVWTFRSKANVHIHKRVHFAISNHKFS